jgi:hypothetical protein
MFPTEIPHGFAFLLGNSPRKVHFPMDFPYGKIRVSISITILKNIPHGKSLWIVFSP